MAEGTTAEEMSVTKNECSQIKDLIDQPLSDGDTWYKISKDCQVVLHLLNHVTLTLKYITGI